VTHDFDERFVCRRCNCTAEFLWLAGPPITSHCDVMFRVPGCSVVPGSRAFDPPADEPDADTPTVVTEGV
jgi:hypothetical protein